LSICVAHVTSSTVSTPNPRCTGDGKCGAHVAGTLRAKVSNRLRRTPYTYLMTRRIERGKAFLRHGMSVTDTCAAVGCTSLGSFSSRFTEIVGETPTQYRARTTATAMCSLLCEQVGDAPAASRGHG